MCAETVIEHFIDIAKEGNIGNKLLYTYLEYALASNIVSFQEFFNSLSRAVNEGNDDLLSPTKFSMFIRVIETFLPSFRFRNSAKIQISSFVVISLL